MAEVDYATVALVALAVPSAGIDRPLDGSGFLVAQPEGLLITACSWASSKWAHLADPRHGGHPAGLGGPRRRHPGRRPRATPSWSRR